MSEPYVTASIALARRTWNALQPYHPQEFGPAIVGFLLCFFGGYFATLTAAVEAYRITGYASTRNALVIIWRNIEAAHVANAKDDELDEDGNGVPDAKELTTKALVLRKAGVVAKAVDPEQVSDAVGAIYMGFVAVVATLRVHFAACVSLGVAVGDIVHNIVDENLTPALLMSAPKEYQKWVGPSVRFACKVVGIIARGWFSKPSPPITPRREVRSSSREERSGTSCAIGTSRETPSTKRAPPSISPSSPSPCVDSGLKSCTGSDYPFR